MSSNVDEPVRNRMRYALEVICEPDRYLVHACAFPGYMAPFHFIAHFFVKLFTEDQAVGACFYL